MRVSGKILLMLLLTFALRPAFAEVGMGDWQCHTPGDHTIDNYSGEGYTLHLFNTARYNAVDNLSRWYFYKGFIVGERKNGYFIVNEETSVIDTFSNKGVWLTSIAKDNVKPLFWTRWYTDQWSYLDDLSFFLWMTLVIWAPFAIIFLFILYRAVKFEKFDLRKPSIIIVLAFAGLVFIEYLLQQFPQSI